MPPPARHQLAVLLLCEDAAALADDLVGLGWLAAANMDVSAAHLPVPQGAARRERGLAPGEAAGEGVVRRHLVPGPTVVAGGFAVARILKFESEQFVGSGQGGFRVRCPAGGGNITAAFVPALGAWRRGGERTIPCRCGTTHDLAALDYQPACGFSREWIELLDVGSSGLPEDLPAGVKVVLRRG